MRLRKNQEKEFLEVREIFEQEFSGQPIIREMYFNPKIYIEQTFAYRESGEIVGGLTKSHLPQNNALSLDFLAVREDWRGRGIGRALVTDLEKFAKNSGISQIRLKPRTTYETVMFYKNQGYDFNASTDNKWMVKEL